MKEIKTHSSDGELIYSKSIIVSSKDPIIKIKGEFEVTIIFDISPLENSDGKLTPKSKLKVDDGLVIRFYNFFHVRGHVKYSTGHYFFRSIGESSVREYYLSLTSRAITKSKETLMVIVNISQKDIDKELCDDIDD